MAEITAQLVKDLRERTGAGMMDSKKALTETGGDFEAAVDWLRAKGLATAAKKAGRTAAEGLVGVATSGTKGTAVEVNSETDFVAKNEIFQGFVREVTDLALASGTTDVAALGAQNTAAGKPVSEALTDNIAKIGENQSLRRIAQVSVPAGVVSSYVHNAAAPGLGKIGVLVAIESTGDAAQLEALGKQIAMHIAAANPLALDETGVDPVVVERERSIAREKAAQSGKPADIVEKMVEGGVRKFLGESTLLGQIFVIDGKSKVSDVVAKAAKDLGTPVKIAEFVRFQLGEGIEKEETDFAAEVAAAVGR
ncbi:translation elongation factor Ts [Sphingosinicella microcystinivorans]|jgi:elongation factor Ts|uniref:Elongation factor Ts n=1 Tax=Sphingosinicella microcystinivorans TaxID=335406 RepID=A0AAD1D729_SPHMI|nr:translation elongation factor Ts [Sphingosinicella microcystinivorans]RKS92041.1 translation elongation factor Ts (EF-Ts) [Sphingosinicella microcystinivorans]BBE35061.1 elongation factor Ts [Sphingosinicella microcystinivorans]|tara:strand:- start:19566 stop:20492 length:927 start_codon:yes stop_codon:yes gene_type:complete